MSERSPRQSYFDRERGHYRYRSESAPEPRPQPKTRDWSVHDEFRPAQARGPARDEEQDRDESMVDWQQAQRDWISRGDAGAGDFRRLAQEQRRLRPQPTRTARTTKGFTRSDERLREVVSDRLSEQDAFDPSDIEVSVRDAEVKLSGTVASRHEKFWAEELTANVAGVRDVRNELRIRREQ